MKKTIGLSINGEARELAVEPYRSLLDVLRNDAGLTGTKKGCDVGDCGACTVLLDENPAPSEEEIRFAIAGNLCRCTGYTKIVEAIQAAAKETGHG